MSFFFDGPEWIRLPDDATRALIRRLNAQLIPPEDGGGPGPFVLGPGSHEAEHADSVLPVIEVSRRRLTFFPEGWAAYRIACGIDAVMELSGYQTRAYAFAICGPEALAEGCTLIDWKSAPLHRLNRLLDLDLSRLDSDQVREYLMFFCTFIGGEEGSSGTIAPYFVPHDASVFAWDETLEDFETLARRRRLQTFEPLSDPNREDDFDLPQPATDPRTAFPSDKPSRPAPRTAQAARRAVADAFTAHPGTPRFLTPTSEAEAPRDAAAPVGSGSIPETGGEAAAATSPLPPQWSAQYEGLVWYGPALYLARFALHRGGRVEMLSDEPITGATALATPRWEVQRGSGDVWLLCRQLKREALTAAELLERIEADIGRHSAVSGHAVAKRVRLRGLRVQDRFERAIVFKGPVRLRDIEFTHDVVLDDSIFERSLELLDCRFLQRLSGRDITVKGALRLDGSHIDGAVALGASLAKKRQPPVLDLRGLIVERALFADRFTTFGRVRCEWIRVGGTIRARGLQIHPRTAILDGNRSALDLSHARIDGPLDLAGYVAKEREPGGRQRTLLGGDAKLRGLHCEQADLSGILVRGSLDLSSCCVKERLLASVAPAERGGDKWWRTRLGGDFALDRAQVGRIEMRGCWTGGDCLAGDLQLSGSLFAELDLWSSGRFRTRIGGDFVGSGAQIRGGLELDGALLGGQIIFVTGQLGRLRVNVDAWAAVDPSSGRLTAHLCATEAGGIILQSVSVASTIQLVGIQLRQRSQRFGDGSLFAHAVRLGAGLRFWRKGFSADPLRDALLAVAPVDGLKEDDRAHAIKRVDDLIDGLSASIPGSLDLPGIRTGGAIDLSRLSVGGAVNLGNARIEGDLYASFESGRRSSSANGFNADMVHVAGDADLRGLLVKTQDFSARDADVVGQLLFATAATQTLGSRESSDGGLALVRAGRLDLEGAKAARIVVSSANISPEVSAGDRRAAIALSRGRFGQLTVLGFEHDPSGRPPSRFPCSIDLSAITVGDWNIDRDGEPLALLEATSPRWFDARNFVEVEERLAKIGSKRTADRIYRRMQRLNARTTAARIANWLNTVFSGNGTIPGLMVLWLVLALLPVIYILKNPSNVEFSGGTTVDGKDVRPISDGRRYDLDRDWDVIKATGLATTYAIPFLGTKPEVVRARLVGDTCIDYPVSRPAGGSATPPPNASPGAPPQAVGGSARCRLGFTIPIPPHAIAMIFSTLQFVLWISVAANLPVLARRRP